MTTACLLLFAIGVLGAIDIAYFHTRKARLTERPESRREAWLHVARGFVYAAQFALMPSFRFSGLWLLAFAALYAADITVAVLDVLEEPRSRASLGGLPRGEYLMHIVLSVLVGAMLCAIAKDALPWWHEPTAITFEPHAPRWFRLVLLAQGGGAGIVALVEAAALAARAMPAPPPIHVRVRLATSIERLWQITQDHTLHPCWDHRFTRIVMLDPEVQKGTRMRYEKQMAGVTICGFGRYKHHRLHRQSTFEFWSDDARSIIARGVGLWLYRTTDDGLAELSTSYTYDVRWGAFGVLFDRLVFRPIFQKYTEQSFRRLARRFFAERAPVVLGAAGRKPERFENDAAPRTLRCAHLAPAQTT